MRAATGPPVGGAVAAVAAARGASAGGQGVRGASGRPRRPGQQRPKGLGGGRCCGGPVASSLRRAASASELRPGSAPQHLHQQQQKRPPAVRQLSATELRRPFPPAAAAAASQERGRASQVPAQVPAATAPLVVRPGEPGGAAVAGGGEPRSSATAPLLERSRAALGAARQAHKEGRDVEAVETLAGWLDPGSLFGQLSRRQEMQDPDVVKVVEAMVALGCWLCNAIATRHLHRRQVARAFSFTRTCERWLALRSGPSDRMWLKLRFDCSLNAAELAQCSDDTPQAIVRLRECERLQRAMQDPPEPEAVHICLAEVLLKTGQHAEAAGAAQRAEAALRPQQGGADERKRYSLLFALAMEQSALGALSRAAGFRGFAAERALQCLPDAEMLWFAAPSTAAAAAGKPPAGQAAGACHELLARMRRLHHELLLNQQAHGSGHGGPAAQDVQPNSWRPLDSAMSSTCQGVGVYTPSTASSDMHLLSEIGP